MPEFHDQGIVVPEEEYDELDAEREEEDKCNTRKDKKSLFYQRTGGIFIAACTVFNIA